MTQILKTQAQATTLAVSAFKRAGYDTTKSNQLGEYAGSVAMAETFHLVGGVEYCDFGAVGDLNLVDKTYGPSFNAWQIRSLLAESGKKTYRDPVELGKFVQTFAADAMVKVYKAQGWKAWSTVLNGSNLSFLEKPKYNPPATLPEGTYRVKGGDTLSAIALKFNTTVAKLVEINAIVDANKIGIGQIILLPIINYTIKSTDTSLSQIAAQVGRTDWYTLWTLNKATIPNPNLIYAGQVIMIPRKTTTN